MSIIDVKIKAATAILGIPCPFLQPIFAEATGMMEPWNFYTQFGIASLIAALHWWTIAKTIPEICDSHKQGLDNVATEMKGLRTDMNTNMNKQIDLLAETIKIGKL